MSNNFQVSFSVWKNQLRKKKFSAFNWNDRETVSQIDKFTDEFEDFITALQNTNSAGRDDGVNLAYFMTDAIMCHDWNKVLLELEQKVTDKIEALIVTNAEECYQKAVNNIQYGGTLISDLKFSEYPYSAKDILSSFNAVLNMLRGWVQTDHRATKFTIKSWKAMVDRSKATKSNLVTSDLLQIKITLDLLHERLLFATWINRLFKDMLKRVESSVGVESKVKALADWLNNFWSFAGLIVNTPWDEYSWKDTPERMGVMHLEEVFEHASTLLTECIISDSDSSLFKKNVPDCYAFIHWNRDKEKGLKDPLVAAIIILCYTLNNLYLLLGIRGNQIDNTLQFASENYDLTFVRYNISRRAELLCNHLKINTNLIEYSSWLNRQEIKKNLENSPLLNLPVTPWFGSDLNDKRSAIIIKFEREVREFLKIAPGSIAYSIADITKTISNSKFASDILYPYRGTFVDFVEFLFDVLIAYIDNSINSFFVYILLNSNAEGSRTVTSNWSQKIQWA